MIPIWKKKQAKPLKIEDFKKNEAINICFNKYL